MKIQNSEGNVDSVLHQRANVLAASNESLLWGTYRPNLYFGTRPRLPESLLTGLMWFGTEELSSIERILY